jgi:nicotinamidase-related amidase
MANPIPDFSRAAVLSMDLQNAIVSIYAKGQDDFMPRVAGVLKAARGRGVRVIHVQVGFRAGLPEISSRNALFGAIKSSAQWQAIFQGTAGSIHSAAGPEEGDIVVTKHRVSAFAGTDLEIILRAGEIETLVLMGIATSGVVLSTLLDASDADFRLAVVKDCCLDQEADLHAALMEKLFPRRAAMLSAAELVEALRAG